MAKQKKPGRASEVEGTATPERRAATELDPEVTRQSTLGNQALQASMDTGALDAAASSVAERGRALAEATALALRVPPRDASWTAEMVDRIARSALPEHRKEALTTRLQGDQATADAVRDALVEHVGVDDDALRSALVGALDAAAIALSDPSHPGQGDRDGDVEGRASSAVGSAVVEALEPDLVHAPTDRSVARLTQALSTLLVFGFDEEEDESVEPGNYAHEASGI